MLKVFFPFCLSVMDISDSGDTDVSLCCCLSIRLSELLSVNVGLFDQYFRVVGESIHIRFLDWTAILLVTVIFYKKTKRYSTVLYLLVFVSLQVIRQVRLWAA